MNSLIQKEKKKEILALLVNMSHSLDDSFKACFPKRNLTNCKEILASVITDSGQYDSLDMCVLNLLFQWALSELSDHQFGVTLSPRQELWPEVATPSFYGNPCVCVCLFVCLFLGIEQLNYRISISFPLT